MGVPPLRGLFQTPKIGVGGSVARILQYGSMRLDLLLEDDLHWHQKTGQTKSKCNQKGRNQRMLQYRSVLKEQKKRPWRTCKPMSQNAVLELSTVHTFWTVSHTSRHHKSAYLYEPCLDLHEMPSQKFLCSCTTCFGKTGPVTLNLTTLKF